MDQPDSNTESDTILHLDDDMETLKSSQSEDTDAGPSDIDLVAMLSDTNGDVEYRTVVITEDDDDNIIQSWNENMGYGICDFGMCAYCFHYCMSMREICMEIMRCPKKSQ